MGNNLAISVRGLCKSFKIAQNTTKHSTLAETMLHKLRHPFQRAEQDTFWALNDMSFEVERGDVVGIIGRNGAGKSTLLKVLSQITSPTSGTIDLYGRVGSLLEVGTGFHAELTGRENIYLNGSILGISRKEITRQFDAIVEFSGVEQFLDTPVKRYSSGMYVRLAFAVAAHLNADILIVDEVLAVGDAEFQRKCLGKMKDVATSGRTVLFVSHHMQSISILCNKGMYLEKGRVVYSGEVPVAIEHYVRSFEKTQTQMSDPDRRPGTGEVRLTSVTPTKEFFECAEEKTIKFTLSRKKPFAGTVFVSCHIVDGYGVTILQCDSRLVGFYLSVEDSFNGQFTLVTPWLKPGSYRVDLFVCSAGVLDAYEHACHLEVLPLLPYAVAGNTEATTHGSVFADFGFASCSRKDGVSGTALAR